ncbi:hypothetical protein ASZ78_005670 [Callipepla squamata]|uniref:Centriolin n=1 Tax=Callipepla squamata TaxID=9009 RepID=A0A226NI62_CALSU|nr:hypothetical protein ASZ78_005670 [Callipepla squamata]
MSSVGSSARSPSPLSQQTSPSAHKSRAYQNQQLDATANVEATSESKFHEDENGVSPGVRYITEPLIKSLSKQENLAHIRSLNLSSPKKGDKKFRQIPLDYIENLEKCSKLERLNLSNNQIERIEKLEKLLKLRELNLSCNKISKIEGMEHLHNLQKMNLMGNEIEHIPTWVGKKLRSLRTLNLKQNKISSLHEIAKLKPLQDLNSLFLAGNPVASLPHYRLYTVFHLRALENLDGQPVTNHDRQEALKRFDLEEVEKLERELENAIKEIESLKLNQSKVLEQLHHQDEVNKSLKEKALQQKQSCEDLQRDVDTKNELLKQKTMELTRACQKQYELEQELAFYKIDAKFEPLSYFPSEDVELHDLPGESPYIAQRRLEELQNAIGKAEQQVLEVTGELRQLEDAVAQKKVSQANREDLEQQLSKKIQILHQLQEEALALEKQMEKQRREIGKKQKELEDLKSSLASVNSKDPRHAHMKAQKASKEQQMEVMNKQYKQLESRLDEMLSRIAKETEEIRDLEQQLTDVNVKFQEIAMLEGALQEQREINESLRAAQGNISAYEAELEAQLRDRDTEANQQKEELERLKQLSQMELSALQAELEKERQALENALTKVRLAEEKDQENYKLLSQFKQLQVKSENRQNKNKIHQLENEIQRLREKIRSMEEIQGLADQQLQEADEEKETILAQLEDLEKRKKIEDARTQMQFASLDKELKELKRAIITSDQLAAAELSIAKNQLQALHGTVLKINQERAEVELQFQEFEEAEEFCVEAARAARDLARAEAEIELLQQLLKQREEQLRHEMEKAGEKTASSSQKLEIDKLNATVEQQKAEIERLRWLLDNVGAGNKDEIDNLQGEIAALRNALSCQNDYITSIADPLKRRGCWYYMPPSQASTPASHSTKDSGVGLQCPGTSPTGRGGSRVRKEELPTSRGCWVYSPVRSRLSKTNADKARRTKEDGEGNEEARAHRELPFVPPPGAVIYTVLPDGAPLPQGTVAYGPPPTAADGGSVAPGSVVYGPPPLGAQIVYGLLPPNFSVPLIPFGDIHCNVPKHRDLESELSRLEDTVHHLKSRKYRDKWSGTAECKCEDEMGRLHQNIEDLLHEREELEREVAELRRAAQKHNKRKDFIEGYTENLMAELQLEKSLKHHEDIADEIECIEKTLLKRRAELREADRLLSEAEVELESTRGKTKDTIQKYNHAKQHLSRTETEAEELEQRAQEMATKLVKADQQLREAEDILQVKKTELERLKTQEIKLLLEDLNAERRELDVQIDEKRAQLLFIKKDIGEEEENLQRVLGQINKHKIELKHVLEMLEIENNQLQGLKLQHDQKVNELEKAQVAVLEEKLKLENVQRLFQCQQGEVDWQEQLLQKDRQEKEHLLSQMRALQSNIESLNKEKQKLEEDCKSLEKTLSQARRDLTAAEDNVGTTLSNVEKMELDIKNLQQEVDVLNQQKSSLKGEVAVIQKDLQEKKDEREMLEGELNTCRQQLQLAEQSLKDNTKHQEELLREQATLKEDILKRLRKCKDCQERQKKRENHLQQLQKEIEEKETILAKQEVILYNLQQNSEREGKKLEENTAKLKEQKLLLEKELMDQQKKLEQAVAKVKLTEENNRKLEKEASQFAALEETVRKSKHQISEKELQLQQKDREIQSLQKELELSRSELNHLQGQLATERKKAEKQIWSLKKAMKVQRMQLERELHVQKHENNCLQSGIAAAEQVAQNNHERTKCLLRELGQIQQDYMDLQSQVKTQEDLERRQRGIETTAALLKLEEEDDIKTGFKSSSLSSPEVLEDLEAFSAVNRSLNCGSDNLEETSLADADTGLFSLDKKLDFSQVFLMDEQWRGEALREKLQHHEDRLKAQLQHCMSKQVDVLIRGKQQTQGSLHSLERQLAALGDLVSSASSDPLLPAEGSSSLPSLQDALTKTQVTL